MTKFSSMTKNGYANIQKATSSIPVKKEQKPFLSSTKVNVSIPFNNKTASITGKTIRFKHV